MFALPVIFSCIGRDRLHAGNRWSAHFKDLPRPHGIAATHVRWWNLRKQEPLPSVLPHETSLALYIEEGGGKVLWSKVDLKVGDTGDEGLRLGPGNALTLKQQGLVLVRQTERERKAQKLCSTQFS